MLRYSFATLLLAAGVILAQESPNRPPSATTSSLPAPVFPSGLINTISTKNAAEGDRVYLETVFPILTNGHIVIPTGSWVSARSRGQAPGAASRAAANSIFASIP